jgi:hypothetical protein
MNQGFFHGDYFFEGFGQCRNMRVTSSSQAFTKNHLQLGYSHETNGGSINSISTTSFLMWLQWCVVIYLDGTMSYTPPLLRKEKGISTWHRMQRTEPL